LKRYKILVATFIFFTPLSVNAYSVLTHEAIVDAVWETSLKPLLLQKFPGSTEEQLKEAHAFAYGGAVAPDMGYFPFGSKLFTNLVHYVRGGDFVVALLNEAQNVNEYAFALGALSHYNADHYGHPLGVNVSVPIVYPKDEKKFGDTVTYEQDKTAHLRMEFGFDVLQTARGDYAPQAYHDFIGFKVSDTLLRKAFLDTYGLNLDDVFGNFSMAVGTFRWSVKNLFPDVTKLAWAMKKDDIQKLDSTISPTKFIYKMPNRTYYSEFGKEREKPGFSASVISFVIKILPKIGPLKPLKFKAPTPQAEKYFVQSFDTVLVHYTADAKQIKNGNIVLTNVNYDTGKKTIPREYELADANYGTLLLMLRDDKFSHVTPGLKQNILSFYSELDTTKPETKISKEIADALTQLKALQPVNALK
jgi:Zinc dependent phospholipase C